MSVIPQGDIVTAAATEGRDGEEPKEAVGTPFKPTLRFWLILVALCFTGLLSALEGSIISTALPTIVQDLQGGERYVWAVNGYFLTSTAFQPFYGQTADVFGRRWPTIIAVVIFVLGSGICGGSTSMSMLIAGRVIQGIGGGGINVLVELIVSDLVPLRQRGTYMAIILMSITVGSTVGPFVGGVIVEKVTWRWVFYLNLPVGGLALVLLFALLQVTHKKESTVMEKVKRLDWIGNAIFVGSMIGIVYSLAYAGTTHPWSSWRTIVPLVLGFAGFGLFGLFERSRLCVEPTMRPRLFKNRTTTAAMAITFIHSLLTLWTLFFLPVYFQAVLGSSPARSGVQIIPITIIFVPFAALAGALVSKFGKYRIFHQVGFALMTIGLGTFTLLGPKSGTAAWTMTQITFAAGGGLIVSTLLPAVQAPLLEADTAAATSTWAFIRSFGVIWGSAIPAAVFNNRFDQLSSRISDPAVRQSLSNGQAYGHATRDFVNSFHGNLRGEIISTYSDALKTVWQVSIAIAGLGFLLVNIEKQIVLRTELNTEYGILEEVEKAAKPVSV